jgi:hypothetical protein
MSWQATAGASAKADAAVAACGTMTNQSRTILALPVERELIAPHCAGLSRQALCWPLDTSFATSATSARSQRCAGSWR